MFLIQTVSQNKCDMDKISAVIITKNEERNIGRCLKSLEGIADEIIVIDSFSTDDTQKICNEYGVKFIEKEFIDYSSSKNYGNSIAKHSFIMSVDADEELSTELRESIALAKLDLKEDGYFVNRRNNYCGQWIYHCGWYPDTKLRLFKKSKAKWEGKIHETLKLSSHSTKPLLGDLLHYSYLTIYEHASKVNLFTELQAKDLFERRKKVTILKIIIAPLFEFLKKYIFKKGFLDGYYGFVISAMSSYYIFYKYAKLRSLWIKENTMAKKM